MKPTQPVGVVGSGRMATHFAHYLELSGIPYRQWSRKNNSENPENYFRDCKAVFLLISDDAIASFLEKHPALKEMNPIHFSGSLYMEDVPSIHPLMTFSTELYSLEKYRTIPFIHEKGRISLRDVLPELPNPSQAMDFKMKSLYHSLCVLSGNFTTMLWQKVFKDFPEKLELDDELLVPYMEQTFENLKNNWKEALTGPLARRDSDTVKRNLQALEGDSFQGVYRSFASTVFTQGDLNQ